MHSFHNHAHDTNLIKHIMYDNFKTNVKCLVRYNLEHKNA